MELRAYLDILRRRWKLIAAATLIVAIAAGVTSSLKTDMYTATARVLLRPGDTAELLNADRPTAYRSPADADRYLAGQLDIIESEPVATEAAKELKAASAKELLGQVSASQAGTTDVVVISATDPDPDRAAKVASAFTRAYIRNRTDYAVAGLERVANELDGKLAELQARIAELDGADGQASAELTAAREAAAAQYETLYARQQDLLVTKSLKRGEAELIEEAKAPVAPSSPQPKRDAALGAFVGLLLGLGIAFLREQLDDKIRTRTDAEELTKLPVIAELPLDPVKGQTEIAAHERPLGVLAESVRSLRTSLTFLGVDGPLRRIVVTSAEPGDGKSYVAANLAAVYAQNGLRTVLVSADLRRPRLDGMFPTVAAGPGLAEVITSIGAPNPSNNGNGWHPVVDGVAGGILAKALRPTHIDGLSLLPAGQLPPNPAEILGSDKTVKLLEALSGLADVVVIDTPPVLAVTDAAVLAPIADGVILVAAADQTHRGALTRAVGTLATAHARMLGVVLNKVESSSAGGYGYRGRYYGAYYGTYTNDSDKKRGRFFRKEKRQDAKADSKVEVLG